MGNIFTSAISSGGETSVNTSLSLWDMVTYLLKRYVISKVENDEFLCRYLLQTGSSGTIWNMGQRAITFEPLPSRYKHENYEVYKGPQIIEYSTESEGSEEYEYEESVEYEDDIQIPVQNQNIALYSAYKAMASK